MSVDDCALQAGNRTLRLCEVREFQRHGDQLELTLVHPNAAQDDYEKLTAKVTGLPLLRSHHGTFLSASTARRT